MRARDEDTGRIVGVPEVERFWGFVSPEPNTGCWLWAGRCNSNGYGLLSIKRDGKWVDVRAHRFSLQLSGVEVPDHLFACHRCDQPACVNPAHLFLGKHLDNMRDMKAKGRHNNGKKTHCRRGHPLSGDNLVMRGHRRDCRICHGVRSERARRRSGVIPRADFLASLGREVA